MSLSKPPAAASTVSATVASQTAPLWDAASSKGRLRVGLVGTGYIADFHGGAPYGRPRMSNSLPLPIKVRCVPRRSREHGVGQAYGSLSEMLRGDLLDAVHILTPPDTHADVAREAVEAEVNVLLEKPLDVQSQKAVALCELAEKRGVTLAVSHNFLFSEPYARLREDVRAGRLGPIDSVTITWNRELGFVAQGPYDVWMLRDPANIMLEVGVHSIAHAWDLLGSCGNWQVDASNPKLLPTGVTFFRRWQARTEAAGAVAELNFSFVPGATEHAIHVRGLFGVATADLENNTYTLDRLTPHSLEFDRFFRQRQRGASLAAQAGRNLGRHVFSKLKLARQGNAYGASIAASVAEFYRQLRGERADRRISARFACEVVTAAEQIGQVVCARLRHARFRFNRLRRRSSRRSRACSCWAAAVSSGVKSSPNSCRPDRPSAFWSANRPPPISIGKTRCWSLWPAICGGPTICEPRSTASNACAISRPAAKTWQEYQDQDVEVTRQIGRLCLEKQVKRLVYTGTIDSLYLGRRAGTISDATPRDAEIERRNSYSRAKAAGEELLLQMHKEQSLPLVVLRPAIVIGRDGSPCHWGVGKWNGLGVVELWGRGDNPLPLVLVQDIAAALVAALEKPQIEGRMYNLSSPSLLTAREYIRAIEAHTGVEVQTFTVSIWRHYLNDRLKWAVKKATRHPDGQRTPSFRDWDCRSQQAVFDCSGACRDLGWQPTSDREELIRLGIHEPLDHLFR